MTELHKNPETLQTAETRHELYRVLPAGVCANLLIFLILRYEND